MAAIGIEINETVIAIFRQVLRNWSEKNYIVDYRSIIKDFDIGETAEAEFVLFLEGEFDIRIPEKDVANFTIVGDYVDYIEHRTEHH